MKFSPPPNHPRRCLLMKLPFSRHFLSFWRPSELVCISPLRKSVWEHHLETLYIKGRKPNSQSLCPIRKSLVSARIPTAE